MNKNLINKYPELLLPKILLRQLIIPVFSRFRQWLLTIVILCLFLALAPAFSGAGADDSGPAEVPSLAEIFLFGLHPLTAIVPDRYPEQRRECVNAYLDAVSPESRIVMNSPPADPSEALTARRRNMVAQIVTILGENVRKEAERFSAALPLLVEWEGMSEGPVDEANFADQWLNKYPDTIIAPFLHLFKAHRLRAGFEAARSGHEKGLWPILARRYREALQKAKSSNNPLITCIADDLEAQPYVYLEGQGHP